MLVIEFLLASLSSWALTGLLRYYALNKNILDIPNNRSSHIVPVPRGGGAAIVLTFLLGLIFVRELTSQLLLAFVGAGLLVAVVGFIDDYGHLSLKWRLLAHFVAAFWALALLGVPSAFSLFSHVVNLGLFRYLLVSVAMVWLLNLFNFMDGIDGIASSEAIFIAGSGLFFASQYMDPGLQSVAVILIGSILGFLIWNWPPAKIFMGDVGSGFLGIIISIYTYWAMQKDMVSIWTWMIILAVFLVDATVTLIRRFIQGQKWYEAHRSHAYQHAAQKWGHLRVTITVSLINIVWLFPIAYLSNLYRMLGPELTVLAYLPLLVLVFLLSAGMQMKT